MDSSEIRKDGHVAMVCSPQTDGHPAHYDSGAYCPWCGGEILACSICLATEGTLTTICPGRPISEVDQDRVYKGLLDFDGVNWFVRHYRPGEPTSLPKESEARRAADRLNSAVFVQTQSGIEKETP